MKLFKTFLLGGIGILGIGSVFAAPSLSEKFSSLTQQIIEQAKDKPRTLHSLQKMLNDCANKSENKAIQAACKAWVEKDYPQLREQLPERIVIELDEKEIQVKKIEEITLYEEEKGAIYEVSFDKYKFSYQFPLSTKEISTEALKTWQRVQSGNIAIPPIYLNQVIIPADKRIPGEEADIQETDLLDDRANVFITLYATPWLSAESSLVEVGKEYRKAYQDIFRFKDRKDYYQKYWEKHAREAKAYTGEALEAFTLEKDFVLNDGPLPELKEGLKKSSRLENNIPQKIYGTEWKSISTYCFPKYIESKQIPWWEIQEGCGSYLHNTRRGTPRHIELFWTPSTPEFIWTHFTIVDNKIGKFIFK